MEKVSRWGCYSLAMLFLLMATPGSASTHGDDVTEPPIIQDFSKSRINHVDEKKPDECATNRMNCVNFAPESNDKLNEVIHIVLGTGMSYKYLQNFYAREDQSQRGLSSVYGKAAQRISTYAQTMMQYINYRGGTIVLPEVPAPYKTYWQDSLEAVTDTIHMEQAVTDYFLDLHALGELRGDNNLAHFVEENFLGTQHEVLTQYATYETIITRFQENPVALNIFDSQLYDGSR